MEEVRREEKELEREGGTGRMRGRNKMAGEDDEKGRKDE